MKVLIADDDPVSLKLLQARLNKWGYEPVLSSNGEEALSILLSEDAPRMAVLDWMMPVMDGVRVCERVRAEKAEPYTYIILLSAKGSPEDLVDGMRAGADDYVVKPFAAPELQVRLRAGRRIIDLQSDLMKTRDELKFQATHDPLTAVWNRTEAIGLLEREVARSDREQIPVAVIMMDVDRFKRVNDKYGHVTGDAVLQQVVSRMQTCVRVYDEIGRYGGEEFIVVTPHNPESGACRIAERVRSSLAESPVATSEGAVPVTVSLGVAGRKPGEEWNADAMIRAADAALYRAKARGRNRVELAVEGDFPKRT